MTPEKTRGRLLIDPREGSVEDAGAVSLWDRLNNLVLLKLLLLFACGWAAVTVLAYFELVVVIFVTSTILAFLLNHPVHWLTRWMPRGVAVVVVFCLTLIVLIALAATIGLAVFAQGQRLIDSIGEFLATLGPWVRSLEVALESWNLTVDLGSLEGQIREQALGLLGAGIGLLQGALTNFVTAILIAVITLFMLLDGERIWWWLLNWLPMDRRDRFNATVQHNLLGFFWGRLLLSLFFGVSTFVVFLLLGVPFALVLAVTAGLFDLIPGIGATLGISLICLLLLSQSVWLAIKALVVCVLLQQVEENLLLPHIMRDSLDINPVVMFFALIVGARIAGLLGVFLAIPVAGVIVSWLEIEEMRGGRALTPTIDSQQGGQ
ncbi:AI-2E family transporter [filamentous cyanobacterium CCP5]|nr:AI-2E family transporter [filamentous cyanobacterium CCP5]